MKRNIAFLLTILLLFVLPGCKSGWVESPPEPRPSAEAETGADSEPLRVLVDVEFASVYGDPHVSTAFSSLKTNLKLCDADIGEVEFEYLPPKGEERAAALTHMQTEIMTGKGPDLFICACSRPWQEEKALFLFPTQVMDRKLFLPLDDYIEKAEYMEWDKFLPVIMDAGKNAEGQQIIPLSYTFSALYADREKYGLLDFDRSMTLSEMWQSDNPALRYASYTSAPFMVGRITEPGDDEPMFTEEELLGYIRDYDMRIPGDPKDYQDLQEDEKVYKGTIMRGFLPEPGLISPVPDRFVLGNGSPAYRIIPAKNARGGVTAVINEFAAINRNARHPDLAFKIIDYLMDAKNQQGSDFFYSRVSLGMPVHMDLGSEEYPLRDKNWYMSAENFEEFCAARAEITEAKFIGPADQALWDIESYDEKGLEKSVHQQYTLIEMLLAES